MLLVNNWLYVSGGGLPFFTFIILKGAFHFFCTLASLSFLESEKDLAMIKVVNSMLVKGSLENALASGGKLITATELRIIIAQPAVTGPTSPILALKALSLKSEG
jgi:hypothetical protein